MVDDTRTISGNRNSIGATTRSSLARRSSTIKRREVIHQGYDESRIPKLAVASLLWSSRSLHRLLLQQGYNIGDRAAEVLRSGWRKPRTIVKYRLAILRAREFHHQECTVEQVFQTARRLGLVRPPIEVGPLLRLTIDDSDIAHLGVRTLLVMHPGTNVRGSQMVFAAERGDIPKWLGLRPLDDGKIWGSEFAFVFRDVVR